jgi:dTDP-4-amino-4,6-dideoxygalactose transaminase
MSVDSLKDVIARDQSIKLVCLTHVGGWLAKDYDLIAQYCRERKITLVEDCAHVFGVPGAGRHGEVACWSFYSTKALPIGDGGALSTLHPSIAEFAALFGNYGKWWDEGVMRYTRGFNLRISEWNAAVLCIQLDHETEILQKRAADAHALHSIAPCLMSGPTNWYKYPVAAQAAAGLQRSGAVYLRTDQLDQALGGRVVVPVSLNWSHQWAETHACLPIGEGLYAGMSSKEIREALTL